MMIEDNGASSDDGVLDEGVVTDDANISADDSAANDDAGQGDEGSDAQVPKPKKSAQERIDELTRARRDAERRADMLEGRLAQLEISKPKEEAKPVGDGRPDPANFAAGEYDPAYVEALIDWKADQKVSARLAEQGQKTEAQQRQETFQQRIDTAKTKFSDFDEKVFGGAQAGKWVCTTDMLETMKESELGPEVAYHLASNPAEAQRIASLSSRAQAVAIGRLEATLSEPKKPQPKTVSDAPDPAPTTRGTSGRFQVAPDTNDFAAFDKAY